MRTSVASRPTQSGRGAACRATQRPPGARYYYAIGSDKGQLSTGSDHYIQTAPSAGEQTRIWVLGDAGTGTSDEFHVRDAYYSNVGTEHTDTPLMLPHSSPMRAR